MWPSPISWVSYLLGELAGLLLEVRDTDILRGIIGPILVAKGYAFGIPASDDPKWSSYISYWSLTGEFTSADHPSPRYWLLWPGVLCMIAVSFTGKFPHSIIL